MHGLPGNDAGAHARARRKGAVGVVLEGSLYVLSPSNRGSPHPRRVDIMSHQWLCVLSLGLGLGCTSWDAEHSVMIEAPPETVWEILIDLPSYASWNSYSPSAVGSIREGGVVTIEAQLGEEIRVVDNRVTRFDPESALCWHSMNWFEHLARGTRCRFLEPVGANATRFRHHEIMEGPLAWLIEKVYRPRIEAGLAQMNRDLKRATEGAAP